MYEVRLVGFSDNLGVLYYGLLGYLMVLFWVFIGGCCVEGAQ